MQSHRALSRRLVTQVKRTLLKPTTTRKMSLFPRTFIADDPVTSFSPLFRLLDDFDDYSRGIGGRHHRSHLKAFTPKFDVKETAQAYELHGELPGIEQKDVEIEFTDQQTLTVKGRTERSFTKGTPAAGFIEEPEMSGRITEGGENDAQKSHKDNTSSGAAVVKTDEDNKEPDHKYWVSERSVGEFSRSFSFPTRVDQDQVKASMKNGILSILVPKLKKTESRKIAIS
ncbi:HSP20-like chaperone [Halenospora varia]|nr:HSP20-like chaperone [Halenospora varia]